MEDKLRKTERVRALGLDPYPYDYPVDIHAAEIHAKYKDLLDHSTDSYHLAGRIMLVRRMGKATFMHIQDQTGRIQLYLNHNSTKDYEVLKFLDTGDIIGVQGSVFRTKTGEISIAATEYNVLCKSLRDLPEKFHGLQDPEKRYRKRYLDLIMNEEVRNTFRQRTKIITAIRQFMNSQNFMEVDTPTLQTIYGGAEARPFKTHINAWNMPMYLSISPELFLKRLLVGGFEKVYTLCKNFRNEGVDKTHNPEFSMMELYQSYVDYNEMMKITENLYEYVATKVLGTTVIEYDGHGIDVKAPWTRLTVHEALKKHAGIDVESLNDGQIRDLLISHSIETSGESRGVMISTLFEVLCEHKLIQPVFITDYPKEMSPLCKKKRGNPALIEKVEPYIMGWEMGNGYSELNDPLVQRSLLEEQGSQLRAGQENAHPHDEDFLQAIEHGMPPAGGMGIGIDRMIMLFTSQKSIRDVILFPTMKPEQ